MFAVFWHSTKIVNYVVALKRFPTGTRMSICTKYAYRGKSIQLGRTTCIDFVYHQQCTLRKNAIPEIIQFDDRGWLWSQMQPNKFPKINHLLLILIALRTELSSCESPIIQFKKGNNSWRAFNVRDSNLYNGFYWNSGYTVKGKHTQSTRN